MHYPLKRQIEKIGPFSLEIECLEDLNQAIDQVFAQIDAQIASEPKADKNTKLLEELCPYFGVIWPSARAVSEYLSSLPEDEISQKTLLELGCGLGLPSMIAAKRGALVSASDFHPEVEALLIKNCRRNELQSLRYSKLNWETESVNSEKFDWIIGSDLLYEQRFAESLARTISSHLKHEGKAVISDPGRPYLQPFVDAMLRHGFRYHTLVFQIPHPPTQQEVFLLVFERPL